MRDEIKDIWQIDRSELIEAMYYLVDGSLVLRPEHHVSKGWAPGKSESETPILEACHDRGCWFHGFFDDQTPVGVVVLESRFIGKSKDQLQLMFLHVSNRYRDHGLGKQLFNMAATEAHRRGAKSLYVSATPSEHTINFYLRLGCTVAAAPEPDLLEMEPEDIHLEYTINLHNKGKGI